MKELAVDNVKQSLHTFKCAPLAFHIHPLPHVLSAIRSVRPHCRVTSETKSYLCTPVPKLTMVSKGKRKQRLQQLKIMKAKL